MINRIGSIMESLYYVKQAEQANKTNSFSEVYDKTQLERVAKVQKISRLNALNEQEQENSPNHYFKTEVVDDEHGDQFIVLTSNHCTYRQVNLVGANQKQDLSLINPVKVKVAYFNDEDE